jgi:hypothetical protein
MPRFRGPFVLSRFGVGAPKYFLPASAVIFLSGEQNKSTAMTKRRGLNDAVLANMDRNG